MDTLPPSPIPVPTAPPRPAQLLDRVRETIRIKHYSRHTEDMYVFWVRRFILFHNKRHPESMGCTEIEAFLSHLTAAGGDALPRLPALDRLPVVASLGVEVDKVLGACATWRAEMMLSPYGRWTSGIKRNILRQSPTVGSSRLEG